MKSAESRQQLSVEKENRDRNNLENKLREKITELNDLQSRYESHTSELQRKLADLVSNNERLKSLETLRNRNYSSSPMRNRSVSPSSRSNRTPALADATFTAVQSALSNRSLQVLYGLMCIR